MTISDSACRCVVLASGTAGQVSTCPECGTIHIAMPQMSLRLTRETFRGLAQLVTSAHVELDGGAAQPSRERRPGRALH